jgi:hypothetical protein
MIQVPKPEPQIMRYTPANPEWAAVRSISARPITSPPFRLIGTEKRLRPVSGADRERRDGRGRKRLRLALDHLLDEIVGRGCRS